MNIEKINIEEVKFNPSNPRIIRDNKFKKLVRSIKDFPQMLSIRPIVVDNDMIVLGGNMRLKACKEAGLKEVFIIKADNLTEEQKKEFIIKDNSSFGEWDFDILVNNDDWDLNLLTEWGIDVPKMDNEDDDEDEDEGAEVSQMWFLNIEMDNEKECQEWYEKLKNEGLNCKIVQ